MHRKHDPHPLGILALFAALAIVWTWPLARQLSSRIAFDPGDPLLNAWILWWNAQALPFTDAWWSPPIFYPMRGALALSETLAGIGLFTTPLVRLGASAALAYNVALLLSYALSGFFCYLLVKRLTGSTAAALCSGLAYAFTPFRAGQLSHLQVLTSQWLPLQLLGLHAYVETRQRRWLVVFGAAWAVQGLSNGYYLLFAPALLGLWAVWFLIAARRWRETLEVAVAWSIASLALLPAVLGYREVHAALGLVRSRSEIVHFNGTFASFLKPPPMLAVWPRGDGSGEDYLFPGLTIIALVAVGLVRVSLTGGYHRHRSASRTFLFYVLAALFMAALTLGPAEPGSGILGWLKPYEWFMKLPGFSGLRVPVRYAMLLALCLAVAGGLALRLVLPSQPPFRWMVAAIVATGIIADGFMKPMPVSAPPGRVELALAPGAAVLELPPDDAHVSLDAMFRSMSHRRPLVNGYSGHIPRHYEILSKSLRRNDPSAIVELARGRPLLLLVSDRRDPTGQFRRLVESIPGTVRGEFSSAGTSYLLPAQPAPRRPSGGIVHAFTAATLPRRHAVLDFGTTRVIRSLSFAVRNRYDRLDRRLAVETSADGQRWTLAWEDWTGGVAMAAALQDPVLVPVQFVLPDLSARYLRIHPAPEWLVDELVVSGP